MERIDLHTHSHISDGTDTPSQLIDEAVAAGLNTVAITDHDTNRHWDEAKQAASGRIKLILGTEVSTILRGQSVHMLAYSYQAGGELDALMERARQSRIDRLKAMTEQLSGEYRIKWDDVLAQAGQTQTVGRPHLADALVEAGYFDSREGAFQGPLASNSAYYVNYWAPTPEDAIAAIRKAGGVPVIAHAFSVTRHHRPTDVDIDNMVKAGLGGMERDHRDHGPEQRRHVDALCAKYDLPFTGASDYHGDGKPNRLGENLTHPQQLARLLATVR